METLITLKTAKLAKKKGFDVHQKNVYVETLEHTLEMGRGGDCTFPAQEPRILKNRGFDDWQIVHCQAPSQSVLQKWLREEHNIEVWATPYLHDKKKEYNYMIVNRNVDVYDLISGDEYNTFEEAFEEGLFEEGLFEALNLI